MNQIELHEVLTQHKLWLDTNGAEGKRADLCEADLYGANLYGANLRRANLTDANLTRANLTDAKLPPCKVNLPEGSFIGWKKCKNEVILKLEIPADAKRTSSLVGNKCRASKVRVLEAKNYSLEDGDILSTYNPAFKYVVGETIEEPNYDDDIRVECTSGIHFFMTREEAENY